MTQIARATVTADVAKIRENAATLVSALPGVSIVGVTKVTCASPEIARAMLAGGVAAIGESRLENAQRLRDAGINAPIWLVRAPVPSLAADTVRLTDVSLVSEIEIARALDDAALEAGTVHEIIAMVDIGDLREGMLPAELPEFLARTADLAGVRVIGIGASLTCYGGVVPSAENTGELADLAAAAERQLGRPLVLSAGSSTSVMLVASGKAPASVDNLRLGESIVLGVDPSTRERILGLHTDAITVAAPVIECKVKPSVPRGQIAQDAFGNTPVFEDRGERLRAICAIGRQDAPPGGLVPRDPRVQVRGASSDHLILDVDDLPEPPRIGDAIEFVPGYAATLALYTSPYVDKRFVGE
jgi:predicted amino acid racemase